MRCCIKIAEIITGCEVGKEMWWGSWREPEGDCGGKYDKIHKTSEIFKEYMKTLLKIRRLAYGTVFQENFLYKRTSSSFYGSLVIP